MTKRFSKRDVIFLGILVVVLTLIYAGYVFFGGKTGDTVEITIDGVSYGTYSLSEEQEIPIEIDGTVTNVLKIEHGEADMIEADCPDQLCVHQKAISKDRETIVCLPNKVVVEVKSKTESEFDSIAK